MQVMNVLELSPYGGKQVFSFRIAQKKLHILLYTVVYKTVASNTSILDANIYYTVLYPG